MSWALFFGLVQKNKTEIHRYENSLVHLENEYLSFNRDIQELILVGYTENEFYKTNGYHFKQVVHSHNTKMDSLIGQIGELSKEFNLDIDQELSEVLELNKSLYETLDRLKSLILRRGFRDYGTEGLMRAYAHILEEKRALPLASLLQLRRHEKDFLLRGDSVYVNSFNSLHSDLMLRLQNTLAQDQLDLLEKYAKEFNQLANLDAALGLRSQTGIYQSIQGNIKDLRQQIAGVISLSKARIEQKIAINKNLLIAISLLGSLGVVIFSIIMSRLLSKDLNTLARKMRFFGKNEFQTEFKNRQKSASILEVQRLNDQFNELGKTLRDKISELEEAKIKAEQISKYKSMFLANMSHEIRTPLNGIVGMVHVMQKQVLTPQQQRYMEVIAFSADHLLSLVNMILDYSKIDAGKMELEESSFNLSGDFSKVFALFKPVAQEKGIAYEYYSNLPDHFPVLGDSLRIHQILINLLNNALKFTDKGLVKLSLVLKDEDLENCTVLCKVEDSGIGIAETKIQGILEAFEQSDKSTTRQYGGTGLGLTISNQLLNLMNSQLNISSTEGKGSSFSFCLQLKKSKLIQSEGNILENVSNEESFKVLVAEDNFVNQEVIQVMLDMYPVEINIVDDGLKALEAFQDGDFHLILMDLQMPVLDGWEACKQIRESEKYQKNPIPIVAVTANAFNSDKEEALRWGFTAFLGKPIQPDALEKLLSKFGVQQRQMV
ncbi:MAG: ATP-binding protein [Luteibaculum sp.]